jgi:hypothetical protein
LRDLWSEADRNMASPISYSVQGLQEGSGWTWKVKVESDGAVIASGFATTEVSARVTAIRAAFEVQKRRGPTDSDQP